SIADLIARFPDRPEPYLYLSELCAHSPQLDVWDPSLASVAALRAMERSGADAPAARGAFEKVRVQLENAAEAGSPTDATPLAAEHRHTPPASSEATLSAAAAPSAEHVGDGRRAVNTE